jgi:hypothetical protein
MHIFVDSISLDNGIKELDDLVKAGHNERGGDARQAGRRSGSRD